MIAALVVAAALAWQPANDDLVALKRAALTGHFPIHYITKKPSEMPRYDPIAFYPGPADPRYIWENRTDVDSPQRTHSINRALVLAAMDFGAAGERWKSYYDDLVAEDAAQHPPVSDPYHYRHAFLDDMDARLAALAPVIPATPPDAAIDAEAGKVSADDLARVTQGYFSTPAVAVAADLPPGVLARYAGPQTKNKYVVYFIERNSAIDVYNFYTDRAAPGSDDAVRGAFFEAIVDSGTAGPELKASYDAAVDKSRFGLVLARAFDMQNDRLNLAGRDQVAWVMRSIHAGMTRDRVNALLRTHDLKIDEKPRVDILEFPIHSSIVCRTSIPVAFTFDVEGRLTQIERQADRTTCV